MSETLAVRYRLGAEELIELGADRPRRALGHQPFLANQAKKSPFLGAARYEMAGLLDILGNVAGFIAQGLSFAFNTLGDLVSLPLDILSKGVDITFNGVAGLLQNIPILGDLLAQILVLGGSLIKFGLSIPGLVLHGMGNILGGIAKALQSKGTPEDNQKKVDGAKKNIVDQAPNAMKSDVKTVLDSSGVTGSNMTPAVGPDGTPLVSPAGSVTPAMPQAPVSETSSVAKVLAVGLPVIGVTTLFVALAR